jgi:hypothetical protein
MSRHIINLIVSTATSDSGSSTTVESYVTIPDFSSLMDNAITSRSSVTVKGDVVGDIQLPDAADLTIAPGGSFVDAVGNNPGIPKEEVPNWPMADWLSAFYYDQVKHLAPFGASIIDVKFTPDIGPLYRDGDLIIRSTSLGAVATLAGTVYVAGNLDIGQTNRDFTLDLNNQTLFAEGVIDFGGKTTIIGSGVIVALGDVFFLPKIETTEDDFVFIMSVAGTMDLQPIGDYHGSVAGDVDVTLQPGNDLTWHIPPVELLNFPSGDAADGYWETQTYNIQQN